MSRTPQFSQEQLAKIIDEATIYMCACPAQVADQILKLRELVQYQAECETQRDTDSVVHNAIASAGLQAMAILEKCLDDVLDLEGWDRATLTMPQGLRRRRDLSI